MQRYLKTLTQNTVLIILCLNSSLTTFATQETGGIVVRVVGLASDKGDVKFGLYDNVKAFRKGAGYSISQGKCYPIKDRQCEFTIADVPYGVYAIMVYHDENQNGKFDWSLFSREKAGASNYTEKLWSHPDFDKAKFTHTKQKTSLEIHVF
jgi:uncharacterized protein (DUF2141 family)